MCLETLGSYSSKTTEMLLTASGDPGLFFHSGIYSMNKFKGCFYPFPGVCYKLSCSGEKKQNQATILQSFCFLMYQVASFLIIHPGSDLEKIRKKDSGSEEH